MKKRRVKIFLFFIIAFGFLLRVVYLDKYPPAVSWDEISHGYNSYSIFKTGRDEWGKLLPLSNFRAYGDYPLALNLYTTMPFIAILGLSEFSIRLPHAVIGTLTILAAFYLAWGLTKSRKISILTALLVAIEPWNVFFSRFAAQSNLSVFFLTASAAAFFNKEKNKYLLPLSVFFLGLTLYSYHTTRIFSPILLVIAIIIYRNELKEVFKKDVIIKRLTIILVIIFFVPLVYLLLKPESRARSGEVFLINQGSVNSIIEKRLLSDQPEMVKRLLYNRPVYFIKTVTKNHLEYFTPGFLFFKGGTHYQFSVPGFGLLYPANLLFFYVGLIIIAKKAYRNDRKYQFVLLWFLLAPIPGSITKESFAVMRATTMLPLPQIFTAIGAFGLLEYLGKKFADKKKVFIYIFWILYFSILILTFERYFLEYFGNYTLNYSQDRQYGYKQVVDYAKQNYEDYDKIIVSKKYGEPHEFFLFYWPWDPEKYRNDPNLIRFEQSDWYWVDRFDKFYFVNDWDIPGQEWEEFKLESGLAFDCVGQECLLITSPGNYPKGWNKIETVNFLDGKPAFEILEN